MLCFANKINVGILLYFNKELLIFSDLKRNKLVSLSSSIEAEGDVCFCYGNECLPGWEGN